MTILDFGGRCVSIAFDDRMPTSLVDFVDRAATHDREPHFEMTLSVLTGPTPGLTVDHDRRHATLTVRTPGDDRAGDDHIAIGLLQAAARCLAILEGPGGALVHGGAVRWPHNGPGIAVIDGHQGQGKTSLALALAVVRAHLVADEFLFITACAGKLVTWPAARLPWHIRPDMARHLTSDPACASTLRFAAELGLATSPADQPVTIEVVLVPDATLPAGTARRVRQDDAMDLLEPAVTDHRAKLADATLDHVSVFDSPDQVRSVDGRPLSPVERPTEGEARVLDRLAQLPVHRVGIGRPADIFASVAAARRAITSP
jgi:hypothetical protein